MNLRRVAIGVAVAVGFAGPVALVGTDASAAPTSGSASTVGLAAAGQWITFSGHVSGGVRPVYVYWGSGKSKFNSVKGMTRRNGSFAVNYRMMTMPSVTYTVFAPKYRGWAAWTSPPIRVKGRSQDVAFTCVGRSFAFPKTTPAPCTSKQLKAQLTWTNLQAMTTANAAIPGRTINLQLQTSPGTWTTVQSQVTGADGSTTFDVPSASPSDVYRADAAQLPNGLSAYVSFPVWMTVPNLRAQTVNDPASPHIMSPMPDSNNGAAQRYNWWPNNLFWDQEQGEGMQAQGCTTHCANWSEYSTGSGRVNIRDGQIALESYPASMAPGWGFMSSTMQWPGYKTGRWEMRVHMAQYPNQSGGTSPYTAQISLVPAGTPDSVRTPSKQIILAQWKGYNGNTVISVNDGRKRRSLTLHGVAWNRQNWHLVAVQIIGNRLTWLLDGHVVGQAPINAAITGTKWVARIEMIDRPGYQMDRARGGIDWVRYFTPKRSWARPLPGGPTLR